MDAYATVNQMIKILRTEKRNSLVQIANDGGFYDKNIISDLIKAAIIEIRKL